MPTKPKPNRPKLRNADFKAKTQPHLTLLAQDNFTPGLIAEWIELAERHGVPAAKINEARAILGDVEQWRTDNPLACKIPD